MPSVGGTRWWESEEFNECSYWHMDGGPGEFDARIVRMSGGVQGGGFVGGGGGGGVHLFVFDHLYQNASVTPGMFG